jgi:hypothetical protein
LIVRVGAYLRQGTGHDLAERLSRLEASSISAATLVTLDRVITRRGLVEFRSQLEMLAHRLESPQFEVAVFGRVSSGKSSLLNHLLGQDVLPVGVTPVTAVPTRLVRGDRPGTLISFAERGPRTVPVEELREYASEEGNPGNHKHVTGILVQLPSPRLRAGWCWWIRPASAPWPCQAALCSYEITSSPPIPAPVRWFVYRPTWQQGNALRLEGLMSWRRTLLCLSRKITGSR